MTRSQLRLMVDELAEDVRQYVFHTLDNEVCIQGARLAKSQPRLSAPFAVRWTSFSTRPSHQWIATMLDPNMTANGEHLADASGQSR
jgi:hypothetical protein